ncbi:MAG: helix-turn-helix transcriptional regulator [Microbacterium sp.]
MVTMHTMADAGAALRARRTAKGLSQAAVAVRANVSRAWLNEVENGKSRFDFQLYLTVCDVLDLEVLVKTRTTDG